MKKTRVRTKKYSSKKKRYHRQNKILFGVLVILILILSSLFAFDVGLFEKKHEVIQFEVLDECSLIMGNLIHTFQNEGGCKIKCMNNCEIRGLEFYDSGFVFQNSSCHTCDCYCL